MWAGGIAAALISIGVVLRFAVVSPLKKWIKDQIGGQVQQPIAELRTEVGTVKTDLAEVKAHAEQLSPNGGSHLADKINAVRHEQTVQGAALSSVQTEVGVLRQLTVALAASRMDPAALSALAREIPAHDPT